MKKSGHALFALVLGCLAALPAPAATSRAPDGGLAMENESASDHVTEALDRRLVEEVDRNLGMLRSQGKLPAIVPKVTGLSWPLGPFPGAGLDYHGISNFVDLNASFPNQVRDYTCAARSYDTAAGYNHRGIDYFIWPFSWALMDSGTVDVVAAAPGTLVARADGNNDRSCSMNAPDTPNYVVIRHGDGTIARYLHMKRGSVTTRAIGSQVAAGEVLGKVGSSGISTGPHLHFELRANNTNNAAVIEPHNGQCNNLPTAWASERPYRDSRINRISTHGTPPVQPSCPGTTDQPNFKDSFNPGDPLITLAAYRDQMRGQVSSFRLLRPDNSVHTAWTFDMAEAAGTPAAYNGSYWYWNHTIPANAPHGLWTFEAGFQGQSKRHYYRVGNTTQPIADIRGLVGAWFEPATSGQGMEIHWLENDTALVFFYGHHDNGDNFFALGIRQGRFDYGQEIEFPLHITTGGRFNNFDPALINRPAWGTLKLTFNSCDSAVARLAGTDGNKVMNVERLGRTPGLACE